MSHATPDPITDEYLIHFGAIVQAFARHEILMLEVMAAVSGADVTSIRLLTNGLNSVRKREALFNLLRHRAVPINQIDQIRNYLQILQTYRELRHDIAHSIWIDGEPKNSVRPLWLTHGPMAAIRPVHDMPGDPKPFIEDDDDKVTYTLRDLKEIANNLAMNCAELREYLIRVDLMSTPKG